MTKKLSRRDFLKMAGASAASLALSSCGINPTALAEPTKTATLVSTSTVQPTPSSTVEPSPEPEPTTLRAFADKLGIEIGATAPIGYFLWHPEGEIIQEKFKKLFLQEYNLAVSDWEFHWASQETIGGKAFRATRESFDYKETDLLTDFYKKNGLGVQAHHLIWGYQTFIPSWLKKGNFTRDDLLSIIKEHIQSVVKRYKGKIREWTVVNELFGNPWETNFWQDRLGSSSFDWVEMAFQWANEADPNAKLILNDFGIEFPGYKLYEPKKDEKIFSLIRDMKEKGIPIHGVGFQSHLYCNDFMTKEQLNVKMEALKQNILKYQGLDIDVYITEFDLRLNGITGSQKERFDFQGQVYGSVFKTCLENGVKSFSIFGLTDKYSWLENPINGGNDAANSDPLPFDENFDPKPAYFAMFEVLKELYLKSKTG